MTCGILLWNTSLKKNELELPISTWVNLTTTELKTNKNQITEGWIH